MSSFNGTVEVAQEEKRIQGLFPHDHKRIKQIALDIDGFVTPTSVGHFVYPPKVEEDQEAFADAIKEIVPDKLKLLIDRQDYLTRRREERLKNVIVDNPVIEYLQVYDIEHEYAEYLVIQKWMRYWMRLLQKVDISVEIAEKDGISQEDIDKAREVPIEDLYDGRLRGVTRLAGVCPFHEEKTPSFTIFTNDNNFYCFGCNAHGDVIDYVMKLNKINFIEAIKQLNG